ncbi:hypothetical protein MYSTI_01006 [Myxococcus stipitatus DSM 14675]|uniref:Uncharacterized protein n=1 Tax=Myxococcus stipitatus (strain DSM 14675 / JCM 12634 / Mx s8) TaxID=1278073 RepID=L7U3D4_MYXSD|nr:hypothetical protein [Myxococcus stipitatus]AGC42355.1 hypothetical protein MYSTI_01006 [Myxococcus stipitatus DSM 14675]
MIPFMTEEAYVKGGVILASVLLIAASAWQNFHIARKTKHAWRTFATARGWSYDEIAREIEVLGVHHGAQVSLATETRNQGRASRRLAVLRVDLSDVLPSGLHLESKVLLDRFLERLGKRDGAVGDTELDAALDLKDLNPQGRALLVAPHVREPLLRASKDYKHLVIIEGLLEAEHPGVPFTAVDLEKFVTPTLDLVEALRTAALSTAVPESHSVQRS